MDRNSFDFEDEDVLYEQPDGKEDRTGLLNNQTKKTQFTDGKTPHRCIKTGLLCAGFLGLGLCTSILGPTLLDLATNVEKDFSDVSYAITVRNTGMLVGSLVAGFAFDRFDQHLLMGSSLALMAILAVLVPWCGKYWKLLLTISVWGMSMGFHSTGGNIVCISLWGKRTGPFVQALHFSFGLGAFVSPLIAEPYLSYNQTNNNTEILSVERHSVNNVINNSTDVNKNETMSNFTSIVGSGDGDVLFNTSTIVSIDHTDNKDGHQDGNSDTVSTSSTQSITPTSKDTSSPDNKDGPENGINDHDNSSNQSTTVSIEHTGSSDNKNVSGDSMLANIPSTDSSIVNATDSSSGSVISFYTTFLNHASSIQKAYMVIAVCCLIVSLPFFWFFCSGPRFLIAGQRAAVSAGVGRESSDEKLLFRFIFLTGLFLFFFFYKGLEEGYGGYIYAFAKKTDVNFTSQNASYINAAFWGAFALGRLLAICFALCMRPMFMLAPDLLGVLLSGILLVVLGDSNAGVLWFAIILLGFSMASIFPTTIAFADRYILLTGKAMASFVVATCLGSIAIPWLLGLLFHQKEGVDVLMKVMVTLSIILPVMYIGMQIMASREGERTNSRIPDDSAEQLLSAIEEEVIELEKMASKNNNPKKGRVKRVSNKYKLSQTIRELKKDVKND
ncbi:sodium-dependent glucose transporter 1A-like [Saccoglossus kowalevskii]|uniref:Sodium-dependent glucose transporter 1-like n=1 Tax=Saccoglossus kowalevskii TaxID=10224 RepID=A0ABM0GJ35_SACKO|nr:PREDICTED: sodium-dependent glucose transporter 1-like [Saccoglossus kowalevskii]